MKITIECSSSSLRWLSGRGHRLNTRHADRDRISNPVYVVLYPIRVSVLSANYWFKKKVVWRDVRY